MELSFKDTDKILIVSPHQDDETFGCGGLLIKYGRLCDILLLTDGRKGTNDKYNNEDKLVEIRNKEFNKVCKQTKVNNVFLLNIENDKVKDNKAIISKFNIKDYSYIFVPNRYETHSDHKVCLNIFKHMKLKQNSRAKIYEYEVWTPLRYPTWNLDIADVIEKKKKLIENYKSQLYNRDYLDGIIGLNTYRGLQSKYTYAESFQYSGYNEFAGKLYELMPDFIKNIAKGIVK